MKRLTLVFAAVASSLVLAVVTPQAYSRHVWSR